MSILHTHGIWKLWAVSICRETSVKRRVNGSQVSKLGEFAMTNGWCAAESSALCSVSSLPNSRLWGHDVFVLHPRAEEAFPSRNERGVVPHTAGGLSCDAGIDDNSHTEEEGRYAYPEPKQEVVSLRSLTS